MVEAWLSSLIENVRHFGFHLFDVAEELSLESLASELGDPVPSAPGRPLTDLLFPQTLAQAPLGTLSSLHGIGAFPFHTETAHWRRPVDLVILRCLDPGGANRKTLLVDGWEIGLADDEVRALTQCLMVVRNGPRSFLAAPVEKTMDGLRFRYDKACMNPAFGSAAIATENLDRRLDEAKFQEVHWKAGRYLVFDNRRILHSRASASAGDTDRRIERIYIVE